MISRLLPRGTCAAETFGTGNHGVLLPEEINAIGKVSPRRLNEFSLARTCARHAIARLGMLPAPILVGAHREPIWPPELVGSITHCQGYCAAAVAYKKSLSTLGIDAEIHAALPGEVTDQIALPTERLQLAELARYPLHWDTVLFSAKESVYKAWYPLTGRWLGFEDASITIDPFNGSFTARLSIRSTAEQEPDSPKEFDGRYLVSDGLVLTAAWLAADGVD